ncbi:type II toxin-antitoxin system HicB family antitoxin [Lysinibacillus sphaericus]|uniref:HicB family protein n=2 Tax=Lysinibacillus sphaericus TaxID=1421 RepID=A0AAJ4ZUV2_LYSSH|nr:type II toxin-antitoxin system HicB family antitoxin [Lysinibacillus sphaericus]MED4542381.1 type II toxin-antitoxin system HicB family antitoxin [Lysinibacillus sphaericus]TKI20372.1 type II toxin-antitoxin system HicB family antitoxin [Lysinibacillus sphaericus]GEC83637.1 HicB family protein [Lysinibacillus sphaericus]SUV17039.1 Uncharacterised protein [Lysinibacillus sphaericus]
MSYPNHFIFPVVVEVAEGGLGMYFPDFEGTAILAENITSGIREAKEMLAFRILELEEKDLPVPAPSTPESIELLDSTDRTVFIDVYMPPYRNEAANKAVTKNCTLPRWLRDAAEDAGLNFSQILQASLKEALGIEQNDKKAAN